MHDHYKTLGLSSAATREEIRRAYRILARRYHPDVNPGKSTAEKFREISSAYEVLSDPEKRKHYDGDRETRESFSSAFDRAHQAYKKNQASSKKAAQPKSPPKEQGSPHPKPPPSKAEARVVQPAQKQKATRLSGLKKGIERSLLKARSILSKTPPPKQARPTISSISLLEVSISVFEAICGVRKSVEVAEKNGESRKISVSIPAGVRQGSIIRLRSQEDSSEEVIAIIRVAHHPWLSISHRGLTIEVPVTISEAICGAKVQIPSLGDPLLVTVEPGIQSGTEVRLKGQGIPFQDGTRGDLFIRFMIKAPSITQAPENLAKLAELEALYQTSVRQHLPQTIMDGEAVA